MAKYRHHAALNAALNALSPVRAPQLLIDNPPITLAKAQFYSDLRAGRTHICSEDQLSPTLTPEQRAEDIAEMKAQLLGDLLDVLRRKL